MDEVHDFDHAPNSRHEHYRWHDTPHVVTSPSGSTIAKAPVIGSTRSRDSRALRQRGVADSTSAPNRRVGSSSARLRRGDADRMLAGNRDERYALRMKLKATINARGIKQSCETCER